VIRSMKLSALAAVVIALFVFVPGAFASTVTESGDTVTWTAATGFDNNETFYDSTSSVTIQVNDGDSIAYVSDGATDNVTPNCHDDNGVQTAGPATTNSVTCDTPPITNVVANSLDGNDWEDGGALQYHPITENLGDNSGTGITCCPSGNGDNGFGGALNDTINGDAGDDYIEGRGGADTINGGDGNDLAYGGGCCGGFTGDGGDTMNGGAGQDELHGQQGDDIIDGGAGNDNQTFFCCPNASLDGGPGNDTISGGDGNDSAYGGPGNDTLNGNAGDDELGGDCGGVNNCNGSDGNDTLNGGDGSDYLHGDGGSDTSNGNGGDDYIREDVDGAPDNANGGDGVDQLEYDTICCGTSNNDQVTATLDGQPNDGYHNVSGSSQPDDPNNNFGSDVEWLQLYPGDAPSVVNGNDAANSIFIGSNGADTVDPGKGADNVSTTDGNDTINAIDGYPDTIDCGSGVDTANIDQFDQVVNCENAPVTNVPSAYATPAAAEDLPPSVTWVSPTPGKAVASNASITLEAAASDDHGVSKVEFYVGQRLVCTATTAPYKCTYKPIGADLGRNTLVAKAYDAKGQTSTALNSVTVPRFVPKSVSASTSPKKDTSFPFKFTTKGKVAPPAGVTNAEGCKGGHVSIQFRAGKKTVSNRRVATKSNCTYSSAVTFRIPSRLHPKSLTVLVRFLGSSVLGPRSHKSYTVGVA
jgi:Ca2+-binding RTX toxin-like protein